VSGWSSAFALPVLDDQAIVAAFVVVVVDVEAGWHVEVDAAVDISAGWEPLRFAVVSQVEAFFAEGGPE
jgi:hypothetical protein